MRISAWSSDVCSSDLPVLWSPRVKPGVSRNIHLPDAASNFFLSHPPLRGHPLGRAPAPRRLGVLDGELDTRRGQDARSEEHTSELQSLMRISYAVFCLKKKNKKMQSNKASTITLRRTI